MTKARKRILYGVLTFMCTVVLGVAIYLNTLMPIITGYTAKYLCSAVFVSSREPEEVRNTNLNFSFIKYTRSKVNYEDQSVTSRFLWGKSKAIFREGFGVTLLTDIPEDNLTRVKYPEGIKPAYSQDTIAWPLGNIRPDTITGINQDALNIITNRLITENGYHGNAFAFMVLHKGIPVAEAYKPQFSQHTRFLSWSIAKSFTNALVGILVRQGKIDIYQSPGFEEWKDDDRSKIAINDLLQMQSGLRWNEDYGNRSNVNVMLHCESDMGRFALEQPLDYPAGTHWYYSSGTTNIVNYLIRRMFSNDSLYYAFSDTQLFNKIGIPEAIFEVDPSGTRVGSSYIYASARDYARFALLYQQDGVFNGERILPEGWVKYTTSAASASNGQYGAFFALNRDKELPSAPEDMYICEGHDGQRIFIMPSQELIVVVLGNSPVSKGGMDFDRLIKDILNCL